MLLRHVALALLVGLVVVASTAADAAEVVRVTGGSKQSERPDISADGRYIAFQSQSGDLVSGSFTAQILNAFLYDANTATTTLVSHLASSATTGCDSDCRLPTVSSTTPPVVLFETKSTLVCTQASTGLTGIAGQALVVAGAPTANATLYVVSQTATGTAAVAQDSQRGALAAGGSRVSFISKAPLVSGDTNNGNDQVVRTFTGLATSPPLTYASPHVQPSSAVPTEAAHWSADGSKLVYLSGDDVAGLGAQWSGNIDVYLWNASNGALAAVSAAASGQTANADATSLCISADGRLAAWTSEASNLASTTSAVKKAQVWMRDISSGGVSSAAAVQLVSKTPAGDPTGGKVSDGCSFSGDGRLLYFAATGKDLGTNPAPSAGTVQLYVFNLATATLMRVVLPSLGGGGVATPDYFAASQTGRYVAVSTKASLAAGDGNSGQSDVFLLDTMQACSNYRGCGTNAHCLFGQACECDAGLVMDGQGNCAGGGGGGSGGSDGGGGASTDSMSSDGGGGSSGQKEVCGDGVCDVHESCISCPSDCQCELLVADSTLDTVDTGNTLGLELTLNLSGAGDDLLLLFDFAQLLAAQQAGYSFDGRNVSLQLTDSSSSSAASGSASEIELWYVENGAEFYEAYVCWDDVANSSLLAGAVQWRNTTAVYNETAQTLSWDLTDLVQPMLQRHVSTLVINLSLPPNTTNTTTTAAAAVWTFVSRQGAAASSAQSQPQFLISQTAKKQSSSSSSAASPAVGAIVGGTIGGLVAFCCLFLLLVVLAGGILGGVVYAAGRRRKASRRDSIRAALASPSGTARGSKQMNLAGLDDHTIDVADIELLDRVGAGAAGDVYRAKWRRNEVAVKRMPVSGGAEEFQNEVGLLRSLAHPNIVRFYGIGAAGTDLWIVMEFMAGGSLESLLAKGKPRLAHAQALAYARHAIHGLLYLHTRSPPVLHRDVKPANLLVDGKGVVKLADFGVSRVSTGVAETSCGTPQYMAPEILRNAAYGTAADIYSFSLVLCRLFGGSAPFEGVSPARIIMDVLTQDSRPPIPDDMPAQIADLVQRCWDPEPDRRPTTQSVADELDAMVL